MSWRTVVISKRSKLDYKMNYLIVREGLVEQRVFIKEIAVLIIESTAVALTSYVLCELVKQNTLVIFCDHDKTPLANLYTSYGTRDTCSKILDQVAWKDYKKDKIWTKIIKNKINNQKNVLKMCDADTNTINLMEMHRLEVVEGDKSNREAVAARLYFKTLFGMDFNRDADCFYNAMLNYGYSLILSSISREISANGYLTQIGIKHCKATNPYNLSCDLIEPFRPIVDYFVKKYEGELSFNKDAKRYLLKIFESDFIVDGKVHKITSAIHYYILSVVKYLNTNDDIDAVLEINYEL